MPKKKPPLIIPTFSSIKAEVNGMAAAYMGLCELDDAAQRRALRWLDERLGADRLARNVRDDDEPPF